MFSRTALSALRSNASRSFSTAARRQAASPRTAQGGAAAATAALAAGIAGAAFYSQSKPVHNEGARTIAGEYKTISERSYSEFNQLCASVEPAADVSFNPFFSHDQARWNIKAARRKDHQQVRGQGLQARW